MTVRNLPHPSLSSARIVDHTADPVEWDKPHNGPLTVENSAERRTEKLTNWVQHATAHMNRAMPPADGERGCSAGGGVSKGFL